ncbi:hypothetical protein [Zhongshania aliphaticivorans]|uniref:hypothetical protein n=1 Tax=Zhongshania aliphaticivorans TaxID=1470434 RepID=UPI0012E6A72C|nr:hypothetical protein [Zhongshania aliphaticivorans]CAA0103554.1 Uncharacterised protein [Zhongshania aliphaticivorans]
MVAKKKPTTTAASISAPAAAKAAEEAKSVAVVGAANIEINSSLETKPDNGEPGEQVEVIFVRSRPKHFYRAGFKFTEKGHGIVIDTLSESQLLAIMTEPQLLCERGFIDAQVVAGDAE